MTVPSHTSNGDLTVLTLAPTGRDAELVEGMLLRHGLECRHCDHAGMLIERIAESGAALVTDEALCDGDIERLVSKLGGLPSWNDPPLLLLTSRAARMERLKYLIDRRATTILPRPIQAVMLLSAVRSALADRQRQYEVRQALHTMQQLNKHLDDRNEQLKRLAMELTAAEERERQRLGSLLHDDLQQLLVGAKYHAGTLPNDLDDPRRLRESAGELEQLLGQAIRTSRELSHELSAPVLHQNGLVAGLRWLARRTEQQQGLAVRIDCRGENEPDDRRAVTFVFRAVQELLLNAAKHAGTDHAEVVIRCEDNNLEVIVRDDGRGFDPRQLEDRPVDECGLGLFTLRQRAELFGGTLEIDSAPGRGSCFTLRLAPPRRALTPQEPSEAWDQAGAEGSAEPDKPPLRIMLVDDHSVMRQGLRTLLSSVADFQVVAEADDGLTALEIVEQARPDVVIMDVSMPGLDGVETTRRIKQVRPEVRVVGLSMFDEQDMAHLMIEAGAEAYLLKSGPKERLIQTLRQNGNRNGPRIEVRADPAPDPTLFDGG